MEERTILDLTTLFIGLWLIISVFFLGGIGTVILANNAIVGGVLILVALKGLLEENNKKF